MPFGLSGPAVPDPPPAPFPWNPEVASLASRLLDEPGPLCPECRGRVLGRLGHGLDNPGRLAKVAEALGRTAPPLPSGEDCLLCGGAFQSLERWADRCGRAGEGWEFSSFRCGSRWDPERLAREETLWLSLATPWGESARTAFNRELGKVLGRRLGLPGDQEPAEMVFVSDLLAGTVEVTVAPLFVEGRYRKLDRTLPQTRWPCRACQGEGCVRCGMTGKQYPTSVEEILGGPLLRATGGSAHAFHGMGREDIDARMLGRGRPFVLEISRPRRRSVDLDAVAREIGQEAAGRVELVQWGRCVGSRVEQLKSSRPEKTYRVVVRPSVPEAKVKEVLPLVTLRPLEQRTPTRVQHRRADKVRLRSVREMRWVGSDEESFTLELRTEAGTYVKELIQGDGGRTQPNLAGLLGTPLTVSALDVLEIHDSGGGP